jgi:hypothetical protein
VLDRGQGDPAPTCREIQLKNKKGRKKTNCEIKDSLGTNQKCPLLRGQSSFQGAICTENSSLGTRRGVLT